MKKVLLSTLILALVIAAAGCGRGGDNALATADTKIEVTGDNGSVSLDENVVRQILSEFPAEALGLEKDIYEYTLKLSNTIVNGADGCLVEAFDGEAEGSAAGTFAIVGMTVYIHDAATGEFVPLNAGVTVPSSQTAGSTEPVGSTPAVTEAPATTEKPFDEEENNNKVRARFEKYTPAQLGLEKEITEYIFTPVAAYTEASDGETVYVVKIFEKDGTNTGVIAAFNEEHEYRFNTELSVYERL